MATLLEIRSRLERSMGKYGSVPTTSLQAQSRDAINNALIELSRRRKWYWWLTKDTTTLASLAASTESSDMPANLGRIECILNSGSKPLLPKTVNRQLHYPEGIGQGSDQTYAVGGTNSVTLRKTVMWSPPVLSGGDYSIWYYRIPTRLAAEEDVPDLPEEFHDYLYWRAYKIMLQEDSDRSNLIQHAQSEAMAVYRDMESEHAKIIETLSGTIYATAP